MSNSVLKETLGSNRSMIEGAVLGSPDYSGNRGKLHNRLGSRFPPQSHLF